DNVEGALSGQVQILRDDAQVLGGGDTIVQIGSRLEGVKPGAAAAVARRQRLLLNEGDRAVDLKPQVHSLERAAVEVRCHVTVQRAHDAVSPCSAGAQIGNDAAMARDATGLACQVPQQLR